MKRELKIRIISLAAAILAVVAMATDLRANVSSCTFNNLTHNCILRRYGFKYDGLGRLTSAAYSEPSERQSGNAISGAASYATAYTYGLDSRPLKVTRMGVSAFVPSGTKSIPKFGLIDDLTFTYTGSRLTKVRDAAADVVYAGASDFNDGADSATEYTYDSDGRLLSDANKDISSIKYNALGLPSEITFGDGSSITNLYSASGTLLQRVKAEPVKLAVQSALPAAVVMPNLSKTTDNHIGTLTIQNTVVTRIDTPNGYFGAGKMHYYVRDYQGNIRQVTDADGNVEQDNHYYPYGMLMAESSDILAGGGSSSANPYLFGAKEYLTTAGTNLLDFTARTYDPSILLFQTQDPMSSDYTSYLPYLYCGSDPVNRIDPDGRKINMLSLKLSDETLGYKTTSKVLSDLNSQTGLSLSLDEEGMLQYAKDDDGKPIVRTITDEKGNSVQSGSKTARNFLVKAIDKKNIVKVGYGLKCGTDDSGYIIGLNSPQIQEMIDGAVGDLDGNTLGFGMTFLHELHHSKVGGMYIDTKDVWDTGSVVDKMNKIRAELNKQGYNYGQRTNYNAIVTPQGKIIPFNASALRSLQNKCDMRIQDMYILIKNKK